MVRKLLNYVFVCGGIYDVAIIHVHAKPDDSI